MIELSFAREVRRVPLPEEGWERVLDSAAERWGGAGSREGEMGPRSVVMYRL
jgi:hypothetical protein